MIFPISIPPFSLISPCCLFFFASALMMVIARDFGGSCLSLFLFAALPEHVGEDGPDALVCSAVEEEDDPSQNTVSQSEE